MRTKTTQAVATSLAMTCLLFFAPAASAGHYYESVTQNNMAGNKKSDVQKVKAWVEGDGARVEFVSGEKNGLFADGNYLVTTDAGDNIYLVNPADETYARFNLDEMMATVGQMMNMLEEAGDMVKIEITDTKSEKILEEPGGSILGHATTHYRYESGYTMIMSVMSMKRQNRNDTVMDIWSTDALDARGFGVWLRPDRQMKTGNEGLDEMMAQQFGQIQGFPLKMVMETTMANKKGKGKTSTTTMEVTVLREESVPDSRFTWPDHYTETEVLPDVEKAMKDAKKGKKK